MTERARPIAFVFDMDGTLVDSMGAHQAAWAKFLAGHGARFADHELKRIMHGKTNDQILREALARSIADDEVEQLSHAKEELYRSEFRSQIVALPGVDTFLAAVARAEIPMALATSAGGQNVELVFELLPFAQHFPVVVHADHITHGKPHPEVYLRAAELLGIEPERCLAFEDSLPGLESARSAGMPVIAVATGHGEAELARVPGVVRVIRDYCALEPSALLVHFS